MILFTSMNQAAIYTVTTVIVLLAVAIKGNPFRIAGAIINEMYTNVKFIVHFCALLSILYLNKAELWLESVTKLTKSDFTLKFARLEGDFVPWIQHTFHSNVLTLLSTFTYVTVFPCLMAVSIGLYTYKKNHTLFYALCYAMIINYLVAFPFYMFFPVDEVWSVHPHVRMLILDVFPSFEKEYRPLSGLDNCFPSLHTSISVSMAIIASKSGNRFWRWFTACSTVFIIFSIFYLGIHWFTDMCGGVALGWIASRTALYLSEEKWAFGGLALTRLKQQNE